MLYRFHGMVVLAFCATGGRNWSPPAELARSPYTNFISSTFELLFKRLELEQPLPGKFPRTLGKSQMKPRGGHVPSTNRQRDVHCDAYTAYRLIKSPFSALIDKSTESVSEPGVA